jgi:hypothetical protein
MMVAGIVQGGHLMSQVGLAGGRPGFLDAWDSEGGKFNARLNLGLTPIKAALSRR